MPIARDLEALGFGIMATYNTAAYLRKAGIANVQTVLKVQEGRPNAGECVPGRSTGAAGRGGCGRGRRSLRSRCRSLSKRAPGSHAAPAPHPAPPHHSTPAPPRPCAHPQRTC